MGKVSLADKMRMQTLREQGCGAKAIIRAYPYKEWKLSLSRTATRADQQGRQGLHQTPEGMRAGQWDILNT